MFEFSICALNISKRNGKNLCHLEAVEAAGLSILSKSIIRHQDLLVDGSNIALSIVKAFRHSQKF